MKLTNYPFFFHRLTWEDLSYQVEIKKWTKNGNFASFAQKVESKTILRRQHGEVASGQLVGIIGPSGAGQLDNNLF